MIAHTTLCEENPSSKRYGFYNQLSPEDQADRIRRRDKERKKKENIPPIPTRAVKGNPHTEATKKRISEARIAFLLANPDMVPYRLNHYSKGPSYPETYFDEIFASHDLRYEKEYRIGLYSLDFAFIDQKIDFEVDGSQHYTDERIIASDARRKVFLETDGWHVIVVDWREFQRLDRSQKEAFINDLLPKLTNIPKTCVS